MWGCHVSNTAFHAKTSAALKFPQCSFLPSLPHWKISVSLILPFFIPSLLSHTFMAQLLSPLSTEALKFQSPLHSFSSRSPCPKNTTFRSWTGIAHSSRRRFRVSASSQASSEAVAEDYYAVLGLVVLHSPTSFKCHGMHFAIFSVVFFTSDFLEFWV